MFVANTKLGIGEVTEITENFIYVYFPETEETKKLLAQYAPKMYNTLEEAEASLEEKEAKIELASEIRKEETSFFIAKSVAKTSDFNEIQREQRKNLFNL